MSDTEHWEEQAENWIAWARRPGFDSYWFYRERFFEVLPAPGGPAIDVGCGEGRLVRDLAPLGYSVTGVEPAPTLLKAAREAHPEGTYVAGSATSLPFADDSVDLAIAYNSLMDVDDLSGAVAEIARVLRPSGRFCLSITHPVADSVGFEDNAPDTPFVINGSYLGTAQFSGIAEQDGSVMGFRGWHHPISTYTRALESAGLLIEALREPVPADDAVGWDRWRRFPMFLHVRAVSPG